MRRLKPEEYEGYRAFIRQYVNGELSTAQIDALSEQYGRTPYQLRHDADVYIKYQDAPEYQPKTPEDYEQETIDIGNELADAIQEFRTQSVIRDGDISEIGGRCRELKEKLSNNGRQQRAHRAEGELRARYPWLFSV